MIKKALIKKLEGDVAVAEADLRVFLASPIGVAEHIDYVVTAEKKTALLAEAKSVAKLAKSDKRPLRTIIYAAWDAEEVGLIGSTEWAEEHADELREHVVAYLNTDGNSRGFVNIGGSHVLERFFNQIIEEVRDPLMDISLKERKRADLKLNNSSAQKQKDAKKRSDIRINPLGSGSDYTPFLQHLGISSANISFGGEARDGSYHCLLYTSPSPRD